MSAQVWVVRLAFFPSPLLLALLVRPEENRKRACVGLVVAGTRAGIQVGFYYIEVEGFWSALMTHAALRVLSSPEDNFNVALRDNNLHSSYPVPSALRLHVFA